MTARFTDDDELLRFVMDALHTTPDLHCRPYAVASPSLRLVDDLGIDSIGRVGLFYSVIDALGVDADESVVADLRTIGDVMALARRLGSPA